MAGHSKWANIKHRKARQDAAKGKMWSKCSRAIIVAAKQGGADPDMNLTLRYAIDEAKAANMAKDTILKAIKKGAGDADSGVSYEELRYEGYGPNGVALIIDCLTDNVNRTAPEIRSIFEKGGGKLAKPGAVSFGFAQKGLILIDGKHVAEDRIMEIAIEAGAEDVADSGGVWEITCEPGDFLAIRVAIEAAELETQSAAITMIPSNTVECDAKTAGKVMRLVDSFEDHDDVQNVYTNADIPDEVMAALESASVPPLRYDITFTGRVQGVYFRGTTEAVACDFGVTGWVRNEPDGSVRCVIEGDEAELDRFVAAVEAAKRGFITGTDVRTREATGEFEGFSVRR